MSEQPLYLVKVEPNANNNKFYRMIPSGSSFTVQYGRIGNNSFQTMTYPISKWNSKLNEKFRKGYVDQTRLVADTIVKSVDKTYADIANPSISSIINRLRSMARNAIRENYTISSQSVTQTMIDEAQALLGLLNSVNNVKMFNDNLVDLFRTIPRKMKNVRDHLAYSPDQFGRILQKEQDLLDVMRGQVSISTVVKDDENEEESAELKQTILEALGLDIFETNNDDVAKIKKNLQEMHYRYNQSWVVTNKKTQNAFENNGIVGEKKLLWHGSRNENWWSILNSGLVLRPNAVTTGKMFGYGIYFATSADKSFGYTSYSGSRWAGGSSNIAYMSLFDVAYGKPYDVYSHSGDYYNYFDYDELQRRKAGANCLHAHAGNMLRKDEIVVYKENQITVKYLVELK